jgi:hypothetical protein
MQLYLIDATPPIEDASTPPPYNRMYAFANDAAEAARLYQTASLAAGLPVVDFEVTELGPVALHRMMQRHFEYALGRARRYGGGLAFYDARYGWKVARPGDLPPEPGER